MLLVFACVLTISVTWHVSYKRQELLILREHLGLPPVFGWVCVAHLFSFLCCVFVFCCLRSVSFVPNVASVYELSILDCLFGCL